ncbi:MAG: hypothetical protein ABSF98_22175 [Bryobacteraceae bacterium]|jgi:hypothetical protein
MGAPIYLDGLIESLSRCLDAESARRVVELQVAPAVQERIDRLAEGANNGTLNDNETAEYEALISAADFISILKFKARQHLHMLARDESDIEIINGNAARLNREAMDTLGYQIETGLNASKHHFLRLAGTVEGPADLSLRKGFSRE